MNLVIYMFLILRNFSCQVGIDQCACFYWFLSQYHGIVVLKRVIFFLPKRSRFVPTSFRIFPRLAMFLKFPTFRYNNVNRASKTKVKKSCHSSSCLFCYWRKLSRISSAKLSGITWYSQICSYLSLHSSIYFNRRHFRDWMFSQIGDKIREN